MPDLKRAFGYRPQLIISKDQYDHNALEPARLIISACDFRKVHQAERTWFGELTSLPLTGPNALQTIAR